MIIYKKKQKVFPPKEGIVLDTIAIVWIALVVVFLVGEAVSVGLTSIWFAAGAVLALVAYFLGAKAWLQIVIFIVVSVTTLLLTRPLANKYINSRVQATNADAVIGQTATVTERVDNVAGTGMASVGGRMWTARSADGSVIEPGTRATVKTIEGVKILLVPVMANAVVE